MDQKPRIGMIVFYVFVVLFVIFAFRLYSPDTTLTVPYSDFTDSVNRNEVIKLSIADDGKIVFSTNDSQRRSEETHVSPQTLSTESFQSLIDSLINKGTEVTFEKGSDSVFWVNLLGTIIPLGIIIFIWLFAMRSLSGKNSQAFTFTKSPARKFVSTDKKVTFKDVAGVDEAKQELGDIVSFLKDSSSFSDTGARMPKGILLIGPPGTGKTLLAKAVAGEANVPFLYISGSDFVELFVGVGAARVRDLFTQAKTNSPSIIFIDEIDAVGRHRGAGLGGGHDEREQTLNQILVEMDGFDEKTNVIVIAATNRPDILDHALLRPGRFDKKVSVDAPDVKGRAEILKIHMRGKPIDPEVDVNLLARRTPGFVGADIENLINEGALLAARNKKKLISMEELEEAIDRVIAGPARKSRVMSEKEREIVTYHELGHAIVGLALPNTYPVNKVTIVPRGVAALGYTESLPLEDRYLMTRSELFDNLAQLMGGRAAEEVIFNEITTGASNDLQRATELARKMVCELGMSERLGPIAWGKEQGEVFLGRELTKMSNYSDEIASEIDNEVKNIILDSYEKVKSMIVKYKDEIDTAAKYLMEKETITGKELAEILGLSESGNYYREEKIESDVEKKTESPVVESGESDD